MNYNLIYCYYKWMVNDCQLINRALLRAHLNLEQFNIR